MRPFLRVVVLVLVGAGLLSTNGPQSVTAAPSADVVISQVYGGGGNSGAPYKNDFVELFNRGGAAVSLLGWSVQYASATGQGNFNANSPVLLPNVTLQPGQYFLVQLSGGVTGLALPAPNATGTTQMAATAGKVILATTTTGLPCNGGSTPCSAPQRALIKDLVGYGNANFFEGGAAAPTLSNTTAAVRADGGCTDTDSNAGDITSAPPAPRNTGSPFHPCDPTPNASDTDGDGVPDAADNCVNGSNADQSDTDGDGIGDVCDPTPNGPDTDGDGVPDATDNCVNGSNADQVDTDGDDIGDVCDPDDDGDGFSDAQEIACASDPSDPSSTCVPASANRCKDSGWMLLVDSAGRKFKNQGDCVSFVTTQIRNQGAVNRTKIHGPSSRGPI